MSHFTIDRYLYAGVCDQCISNIVLVLESRIISCMPNFSHLTLANRTAGTPVPQECQPGTF